MFFGFHDYPRVVAHGREGGGGGCSVGFLSLFLFLFFLLVSPFFLFGGAARELFDPARSMCVYFHDRLGCLEEGSIGVRNSNRVCPTKQLLTSSRGTSRVCINEPKKSSSSSSSGRACLHDFQKRGQHVIGNSAREHGLAGQDGHRFNATAVPQNAHQSDRKCRGKIGYVLPVKQSLHFRHSCIEYQVSGARYRMYERY